jgi:hypothetical protein
MGLRKRFKPCGQPFGNLFIARLKRLDPGEFALQRGGDVDRRPANDPQALVKAFWRHDDLIFPRLFPAEAHPPGGGSQLLFCNSRWLVSLPDPDLPDDKLS